MKKLIIIILALLLTPLFSAEASLVVNRTVPFLTNGLVGHWTFDGKDVVGGVIRDVSGQGNNGNPISIASSTFYTTGKIGQGARFDGVDEAVSAGNPSSLQITGAMTISGWYKGQSSSLTECGVGKLSSTRGYQFGIRNSGAAYGYIASNSSTLVTVNTGSSVNDPTKWTHWILVYTPSTSLTLYKNGEQVAQNTTSIPSSQYSASNNFYMGARPDSTCFFTGMIDDVRVYSRALSAAEISRLYNIGSHALKVGTTRPSNPDSGLLGHWTFDGKHMRNGVAQDVSGQGNHGNLINIATTTFYTPGKIGQGASFDGVDDYIQVNSPTSLDDLGPMSISAWVYPKSSGESAAGIIIHKSSGFGAFGWQFVIDSASTPGVLSPYFSRDYTTTDLQHIVTSGLVPINKWSHIILTWDGSVTAANVKIYLNGAEVTYTTTIDGVGDLVSDSSSSMQIGNNTGGSRSFDGSIDDVRIYNRALSADEVRALYNSGKVIIRQDL